MSLLRSDILNEAIKICSATTKIINKYGDLDCVVWVNNDDSDSSMSGWYEPYTGNGEESISEFACAFTDKKGNKQYATINDKGYIDCQQENVFEIR